VSAGRRSCQGGAASGLETRPMVVEVERAGGSAFTSLDGVLIWVAFLVFFVFGSGGGRVTSQCDFSRSMLVLNLCCFACS